MSWRSCRSRAWWSWRPSRSCAPLAIALVPGLRLPSAVLEIVAGIIVGPAVLGWVEPDAVIRVFALFGLALLLFLAGLEIDFDHLRGRPLRLAGLGFALSFVIALAVGAALSAAGQVENGMIVAIILSATSLGIVVPLLKDAGEAAGEFGQLTIAAASIADFATIVALTLFFSREATGTGTKLLLLGGFAALAVVAVVGLIGLEHSRRLSAALVRLQDTTAQIRVRGAFLLVAAFVALAEDVGLEVILGAFTAGVVLSLIDRDTLMTHPHFRTKLDGVGFGFFIPVFFVSVGLTFDLDALFSSASTVLRVPLFLVALLVVRGAARRALSRSDRHAAGHRGRPPPGDLPALHRGRLDDRRRSRGDRRGDERGADRGGAAVGRDLPARGRDGPGRRRVGRGL